MKNFSIILTIILLAICQIGFSMAMAQDTIVLKIDKRNQSLIGTSNSKDISLKEALSQYLHSEGLTLSDTLWKKIEAQIQSEQEGIDISADINGKSLKINVRGLEINPPQPPLAPQAPKAPEAPEAPQAPQARKEFIEFKNGGIRVRDGISDVYVGLNGIHVKDGTEEVHIGKNEADLTNEERKKKLYDRKGFSMNFGLNGWNIGDQTQNFPGNYFVDINNYDISKLKSRYVALLWNNYFNIVGGQKAVLRFGYGIGFDFLNYRFNGNNFVRPNQFGIDFEIPYTNTGSEKNLVKNKLGMAGIQLPILIHLAFQRKSPIQMIGVGGYINYGIRDWVKIKEKKFEDKMKENIDLKRENFRYGLRAEIGIRHFPDLFVNYELTNLIKYGYGPEINTFSFGLLLF